MTGELNGRPGLQIAPDAEDEALVPSASEVETFTLTDDDLVDVVELDPYAHRKAKSAHHPSAWVRGPGMVELLAEAARLLVTASELKGQLNEQLDFVRVTALKKKRCLTVAPTTAEDLRKVEVTWRQGKAHFLASKVLIDAGFPVETGHRERFEVHLLQTSKKGPLVVVDMRRSLDVKRLPKRKRKPKGA